MEAGVDLEWAWKTVGDPPVALAQTVVPIEGLLANPQPWPAGPQPWPALASPQPWPALSPGQQSKAEPALSPGQLSSLASALASCEHRAKMAVFNNSWGYEHTRRLPAITLGGFEHTSKAWTKGGVAEV